MPKRKPKPILAVIEIRSEDEGFPASLNDFSRLPFPRKREEESRRFMMVLLREISARPMTLAQLIKKYERSRTRSQNGFHVDTIIRCWKTALKLGLIEREAPGKPARLSKRFAEILRNYADLWERIVDVHAGNLGNRTESPTSVKSETPE